MPMRRRVAGADLTLRHPVTGGAAVRPNRGFTLIEVMAVILVIGMSLSMVSLVINSGSPREAVWDAIDRFLGTANFAGERAILSGETMGLILEPPIWQIERGESPDSVGWRYRWVTNSSEGWQELPNVPPVSLPPSLRLQVEVEDTLWDYEGQVDRRTPIAAVYSSGDITPFSIEISTVDEPGFIQHIEVDENGELVWLEAPEPPENDNAF